MSNPTDPTEVLLELLAKLPKGLGGSIELLLGQMDEQSAALTRLAAIPHLIETTLLRILDPGLSQETADEAYEQLSALSIVVATGEASFIHDEARVYLLSWWAKPERANAFRDTNRRLAQHFEDVAAKSISIAAAEANRQRIYHAVAADPESGFPMFEQYCREARYRYAFSDCRAAISLVSELELLLSVDQKLALTYHEAKLHADLRDWEGASALLETIANHNDVRAELRSLALFRLGVVNFEQRKFDSATGYFKQAMQMAEADTSLHYQLPRIREGLANAYRELNEPTAAEPLLLKSIVDAREREDVWTLTSVYHSLGLLYRKRNDTKQAITAFNDSLDCLRDAGDRVREAQLLLTLAGAHGDLAEWDESEKYVRESVKLSKDMGHTANLARGYAEIARIAYARSSKAAKSKRQALIDEAVESWRMAERLLIDVHDWYGAAMIKVNLGRTQRRLTRIDEARALFLGAADLFARADEQAAEADARARFDRLEGEAGLPWYVWLLLVIGTLFGLLMVIGLMLE